MRSIQKTNISFLNAILQPNPELSGMETFKHQVFFHKYASISETEIDIFTYLGLRWHWKAENPAFEVTVDTDEPKLVNNEKSKEPHGKKKNRLWFWSVLLSFKHLLWYLFFYYGFCVCFSISQLVLFRPAWCTSRSPWPDPLPASWPYVTVHRTVMQSRVCLPCVP